MATVLGIFVVVLLGYLLGIAKRNSSILQQIDTKNKEISDLKDQIEVHEREKRELRLKLFLLHREGDFSRVRDFLQQELKSPKWGISCWINGCTVRYIFRGDGAEQEAETFARGPCPVCSENSLSSYLARGPEVLSDEFYVLWQVLGMDKS